ncbi:MAG: ATP-binding protein, partial [Chloroflexota bacterium]
EDVLGAMQAEVSVLMLIDQYRQDLTCVAAAGELAGTLKGVRISFGEGTAGWVAKHAKPLLINDVNDDKRFPAKSQSAKTRRSVLSVPLQARGQLIGVIEAHNKRQGPFTPNDQRLLESLANFAALAIENARNYEEGNRQTEQATLYAQDLSTTYRREREQREALDQLRYSFLNVVGHELKTPLTVILQGLETLKHPQNNPLSADQVETIDMVEHQSNYLESLIDGVITFTTFSSKQGKMKREEVEFSTVLDDALALATFKARPKNISLVDQRETALPLVHIDKEQVTEAILHLADNAIKFGPVNSTVVLQTQVDADHLVLNVIDQGPGIAEDQLDRVWDSFTQMNTTIERGLEGLGLGLAMTRYIVEAHQGQVSVHSDLDQGCTFTIKLPYLDQPQSS